MTDQPKPLQRLDPADVVEVAIILAGMVNPPTTEGNPR